MNWDAIGAIGELIGAAAVVATLIYLSIQLRQNTKTVRLSSAQGVTEELQNMFNLLASDHSLAEVYVEAEKSSELSDANRVRYYAFTNNLLRIYENAFLQRQANVINDAHWTGMSSLMIDYSKMAAFSSFWNNRKHWLSDEFQNHMESEIIPAVQKSSAAVLGNH